MPQILYFPFLGPNRRSDLRVVEARLEFTKEEANETGFDDFVSHIRGLLKKGGILPDEEAFPARPIPDRHMGGFASLLAQTALLFQQKAGHRVAFHQVSGESRPRRWLALVEHEHCDVGMTAMKLAVELLTGKRSQLAEPFRRFAEFAQARLLPLETEAIIAAARARGVPYLQLDRPPFKRAPGQRDALRRNSLVQLGHGARALVLDGSLCRARATPRTLELQKEPQQRRMLLAEAGLSVAGAESPAHSRSKVRLLVIGDEVMPLLERPDGELLPLPALHPSLRAFAHKLHAHADHQPVEIRLATDSDPETAEAAQCTALDFDLDPDLSRLARSADDRDGQALLRRAATRLVESLFPDPTQSRIPVIAITGTNGKTTTSRMVAYILRRGGYRTGLVCTDGSFLDDELLKKGDRSTLIGHAAMLARRQVEAAVLETHHRGIVVRGFAFQDCDVGVALNVTDDHIKAGEIDSIEEMAEIKGAVPERASKAAVLFADDEHCRAMLANVRQAKPWLVSIKNDVEELQALAGDRRAGFCVLEKADAGESIVFYVDDRRVEVVPVADIPVTHGGAARFNVSNAMHAAVAAHAVGVSIADIRAALSDFGSTNRHVPGRLNIIDRLDFRVVLDFAHNPDGITKITDFADRQAVSGRKILALAVTPGRGPGFCQAVAAAAAGHFDLYFCKDHTPREGFKHEALAPLLKDALLQCNVSARQIALTEHGRKAAFEILAACRPGDLLVYLAGHVEMHQLEGFIEEFAESPRTRPEPAGGEP